MTVNETAIPRFPILDILEPEQRSVFLAQTVAKNHEPGAFIVEQNKRTVGLWIVTRGVCEVTQELADGRRQVLAELGPGAVFGEMSFFSDATHVASVRCVTEVSVLKLSADDYAELERTAPAVAYRVTRAIVVLLSERLRRMDEWTGRLLAQSTPEKRRDWSEFRSKLYNDWGL